MKKSFLFGLTLLLVFVGLVVVFFELRTFAGDTSGGGKQNGTDNTNGVNPSDVKVVEDALFVTENLKFSSQFQSSSVQQTLTNKKTQTEVKSVSFSNDTVTVVIDQKQFCDSKQKIMSQKGSYFLNNKTLMLTNSITQADGFDKQCVVKLTYEISQISSDYLLDNSAFVIAFQSESKLVDSTPVCIYDAKVFNSGDYFLATDKCNACSCSNGVVSCKTDRVCKPVETKAESTDENSVAATPK